MGLDITAYSNLNYVGHHEAGPDHPYDIEPGGPEHIEAYSYSTFAEHALKGVPNLRPADGYLSDEMVSGGCFEVTKLTQTYRFRAGSYGGYGTWRNDLASRFNPYIDGRPHPDRPFFELLWFADNEGTLCTDAARNLLADFIEHEDAYVAALASDYNGEYFIEKYGEWARACALAADNGLIDFH